MDDAPAVQPTPEGSAAPVALDRPPQVTAATHMLCASVVLGVLNPVLLWPDLARASSVITLLAQAITLAILGWLIYKIWQGRNWSRVTFLILFFFALLFSLPFFFKTFAHSLLGGSISLIQTALQAAALYLLFTQPGRSWFTPSPNNRRRDP